MPNPIITDATEDFDDFDEQKNDDGSVTLVPKSTNAEQTDDPAFYSNLAKTLDPATLKELSTEYLQHIELDKDARKKRDEQYADAIKRSGLGEDAPGGADFEGASRVVHPLIAEAAVDFAARAIKELFPPTGPVKTSLEGKVTKEVFMKADKIKRHMNFQLTKQIKEFRPSLEQILTQTPMGGVQYSKFYWSKRMMRPKFEFIPLDFIYVPFHAADFQSAQRKTHEQNLTKLEFEDRVSSEMYIDVDLTLNSDNWEETKPQIANDKIEGKEKNAYDNDDMRRVYEIACWLEIDDPKVTGEFKYAPYIMSIDEPTTQVLSIYRNWAEDDATMEALEWIVEWPFIPWRGAYPIGLPHLIGGLSAAATGALRALMDSAHINNAPTALMLKGTKVGGQADSVNVGQIQEIESVPGNDDIRKCLMPMPFNPPSSVLLELLGIIVTTAKGVVRTAMDNISENNPNTPVGTELSRVEQGLVVYSAIHGRLHESMRRTLDILYRLNGQHLAEEENPGIGHNGGPDLDGDDEEGAALASRTDYLGPMNVQPVSDPNIFSESQRFGQMQLVEQQMQKYPQLFDARAVNKRILEMAKVPGIDELMPPEPKPEDENPATENIKMAMAMPAFVLPDQDHLAHLQIHADFLDSPVYGQNPAMQAKLTPAMVEHLTQHMLFLYGTEVKDLIEQAAGVPIDTLMGDEPEITAALSKAVAAASPLALKQLGGESVPAPADPTGQPIVDPATGQPAPPQQTPGLLTGIMPILLRALEYVKSITPPPPQDPSQVAAQAAQQQAQVQQAKIQADTQTKQAALQADQQKTSAELQADAAKTAEDNRLKAAKIQADQDAAVLKAQTELIKNREDNATALEISEMRAETGHGVGGLKNGDSIGENMAAGGLVMPPQQTMMPSAPAMNFPNPGENNGQQIQITDQGNPAAQIPSDGEGG